MPRTCLACSSSEREAIDKALVSGEPLRNIAKRVSISPAGLLRHKSHVATTIVKAQERRDEKLGDSIFDEMRRVLAKAWELSGKAESEGDHRGAIVGLREVRECLQSLNGLLTKAEGGSGGISITIACTGTVPVEAASGSPPDNRHLRDRQPPEPAAASQAILPPGSSATEAPHGPRAVGSIVRYLQGMR